MTYVTYGGSARPGGERDPAGPGPLTGIRVLDVTARVTGVWLPALRVPVTGCWPAGSQGAGRSGRSSGDVLPVIASSRAGSRPIASASMA
jgi:hypothetical protein